MKVKIQGKGGPGGGGAGRWTPARPAGVWAGGGERGIPDEEPAAGRGLRRARAGRGAAARAGRVLAGRVATFPSLAFPSPPLPSIPGPIPLRCFCPGGCSPGCGCSPTRTPPRSTCLRLPGRGRFGGACFSSAVPVSRSPWH